MTVHKKAEPTDIHDLVLDLCKRFDVEFNDVARVEILPSKVTVESYQRPDGPILTLVDGSPAMATRVFPVKT